MIGATAYYWSTIQRRRRRRKHKEEEMKTQTKPQPKVTQSPEAPPLMDMWPHIRTIAQNSVKIPDFSNATVSFLVDELGTIKDALSTLGKVEGIFKQALMGRAPRIPDVENPNDVILMGEKKVGCIKYVEQRRFDTQKFKEDHPDLYERYCTTTSFNQIRLDTKRVEDPNASKADR